ncbi:MAG: hypothetical protein LBV80_02910 [Deltaproteobacteria bacterium]|jgi:autotransporter-associated beta strand protein|nr:hypothetical protein [Deltaproteobacteria bacterium]
MRRISDGTTVLFGVIVTALILLLYLVILVPYAVAATGVDAEGGQFGDPQSVRGNEKVPTADGSYFPLYSASNNEVTVNSGTIAGHVFGGLAEDTVGGDTASNNMVTINGGTIGNTKSAPGGNVTGGWVYSGKTYDNKVFIKGGTIRSIVFGGWIFSGKNGEGHDNTVTISGGTLRDNVYGGYSQGGDGTLSNNKVIISGGDLTKNGGIITGGYTAISSNIAVTGNKVSISGGSINNFAIYGGRGQAGTEITDNMVEISGGTIAQGKVFGGQTINGDGAVTGNKVIMTGGSANTAVYGGYSGGKGVVSGNRVQIGGDAAVTGDSIYGGYSSGAAATGNTIILEESGTLGVATNLYGGYVASGGHDAFTGNILTKNSASAIAGEARNFQNINFTYSGAAGLAALYTTATGSTNSGVILNVADDKEIDFAGAITGTGDLSKTGTGTLKLSYDKGNLFYGGLNINEGTVALSRADQIDVGYGRAVTLKGDTRLRFDADVALDETRRIVINGTSGHFDTNGNTAKVYGVDAPQGDLVKDGAGTLIVTGDSTHIQKGVVRITEGTLQLGDGSDTGGIAAIAAIAPNGDVAAGQGAFIISEGAALAYNRSDNLTETRHLTGGGTLIQRGAQGGQSTLTVKNAYGVRNTYTGGTEIESGTLAFSDEYSLNSAAHPDSYGTSGGYVTFTKEELLNESKTVLLDYSDSITLGNSFRTRTGAGGGNIVDLSASPNVTIAGINLKEDKGGALYVAENTTMTLVAGTLTMANNSADGKLNDLYVAEGGTLNLSATGGGEWGRVGFASGMDGDGTLNISTVDGGRDAYVFLVNNGPDQTFHMGKTNAYSDNGSPALTLYVGRLYDYAPRVVFRHSDEFRLTGSGAGSFQAVLGGDGHIQADRNIEITNGAVLSPAMSALSANPNTLTLDAPNVTIKDFTLASKVGYGTEAIDLGDGISAAATDNDLLNIITGGNQVTMGAGTVYLRTATGTDFTPKKYFHLIKSDHGFNFDGKDVDQLLRANVDGLAITPEANGPRGGYTFTLGGDSLENGQISTTDQNNIWLENELNSLTLSWNTGAGLWTQTGNFLSSQKKNEHTETNFLSGDKIHLDGSQGANIRLEAISSPDGGGDSSGSTLVSGLVVGQTPVRNDVNASYTITGSGGFRADATTAFGNYLDPGSAEGQLILEATGKLEKHGGGTLTFANTGGNMFTGGVDLYGGTVALDQGEQLVTGMTTLNDRPIAFMNTATLQSYGFGTVALGPQITIADGASASLDTQDYSYLLLDKGISGINGGLAKDGPGVVQLGEDSRVNTTVVRDGTLHVITGKTHANTGSFEITEKTGSRFPTLSGDGVVQAGRINIYGNLSPNQQQYVKDNASDILDKRYGTLTLESGSIALGNGTAPFAMDFNVNGSVAQDNLVLKGTGTSIVDLRKGIIDFYGTLPEKLRVIQGVDLDPSNPYNLGGAASLNDVLTGRLNGIALTELASAGPRGHLQFLFGGDSNTGTDTDLDKNIWLASKINSLTMDWTKTSGSGYTWTDSDGWTSLQIANSKQEKSFNEGDFVHLSGADSLTINIAKRGGSGDAANDTRTLVSGLVAGKHSVSGDTDGDITLTGSGGLYALMSDAAIVGEYLATLNPDEKLTPSGTLEKYGSGALTFKNTGGNLFEEGVNLHAGTVAITSGDQLLTGKLDNDKPANDKFITFKGDATLENANLAMGVEICSGIAVSAGATGILKTNGNLLLGKGISGDGSLTKTGDGAIVIMTAGAHVGGTTAVDAGTLHLQGTGDYTSDSSFTLSAAGTLSGKNTIQSENVLIRGKLDPNSRTLGVLNSLAYSSAENYGTLTLQTASPGGAITLDNGFTMDFDVSAGTKDLLVLTGGGTAVVNAGTINFRGPLLSNIPLLVVDGTGLKNTGTYSLGNASLNETLTVQLNGGGLNNTPRGAVEFQFGDDNAPMGGSHQKNIWLTATLNSLTMDRGTSGIWTDGGAGVWKSLQVLDGKQADSFNNGDLVYLSHTGGSAIEIELAAQTVVSGLVTGKHSQNGDAGGDITLTGSGGLNARKAITGDTVIVGKYLTAETAEKLTPTGILAKHGGGTLRFANTGDNYFEQGIELHGGAIEFNRREQLATGGAISFLESATLRPYQARVELAGDMAVAAAKTATFDIGGGDALLLTGAVNGNGGYVNKTGDGVLQFSGEATTSVARTSITGGEFRIADKKTYNVADVFQAAGSGVVVAGGGGGSRLVADTIEIIGGATISPDEATFTETVVGLDGTGGDRFGLLELSSSDGTTLSGFTFRYDVNKSDAVGAIDPTKDYTNQDQSTETSIPRDQLNDLLVISGGGPVTLANGVIDFQGSLSSGKYLIISSNQAFTGIDNSNVDGINNEGGVLKALQNGHELVNETPRGSYEFTMATTKSGGADAHQVWLETTVNSLSMNRNAGGDWTAKDWTSRQQTPEGKGADTYNDGDLVALYNDGGSAINIRLDTNALVSGLTVGLRSDGTEADGDVILNGPGYIAADDSFAFGRYLDATPPDSQPRLIPTGRLEKDGKGTLLFNNTGATNNFAQGVEVLGGTLSVGTGVAIKTSGNFNAHSGTTLSGTGTLSAAEVVIQNGARLAPGGLTPYGSGESLKENPLTIDGGLTIAAGGAYDVRITDQYLTGASGRLYSDSVIIRNGPVAIQQDTALNVAFDYWGGSAFKPNDEDYYTIIDASNAAGWSGEFTSLSLLKPLPRGVTLEDRGWNDADDSYRLVLSYDENKGFNDVPGLSHNENEIGKTIDDLTQGKDPGVGDLIDRMSDIPDAELPKALDQLTGDLAANSLYMGFKEPWRHPFNRLDASLSPGKNDEAELHRPRAWSEASSRYQTVDNDGNARGFTLNRTGAAFGVDTMIAPRTVLGAAFRYTHPHLQQSSGDVYADDYEVGLYGLAGLPGGFDMKMYLGYSHQEYELARTVSLPATQNYGRLRENLNGETRGDAVAASIEALRPIAIREDLRIIPGIAIDYEKVWMDGYRESEGQTSLRYNNTSMERLTARIGLKGEYTWNDKIELKAWTQYAQHLNDRDYPRIGVRFANATQPGQRAADIRGARTGQQYINLGFGANWKLDENGDKFLYINYDAKLNNRMTDHAGEIGFMISF